MGATTEPSNVEVVTIEEINRRTRETQAMRSSLVGLALSGGGIRSATFALGFLQAMAERKLLG